MRSHIIDTLRYSLMKIVPSDMLPNHPTRKRRVFYQAHPHLVWLFYKIRRWVWIAPYITQEVPDWGDSYYVAANNTLYMPTRHYYLMQWRKGRAYE